MEEINQQCVTKCAEEAENNNKGQENPIKRRVTFAETSTPQGSSTRTALQTAVSHLRQAAATASA